MIAAVITTVVFTVVAAGGIAALIMDYRRHGRKRPTSAYCSHPANQPTIKHIGGGEYLCKCRHCPDMAVIPAPSRESARSQYSAHPCAAMPAPPSLQ